MNNPACIQKDWLLDKYRVLIVCTGNSARSIMAEALFNKLGRVFNAFSAGVRPTGRVNPYALELVASLGLDPQSFSSKSLENFTSDTSPPLDFIITVCDQAANEDCPNYPGAPQAIHWSFPDPAAVQGDTAQVRRAFRDCFAAMKARVNVLTDMPLEDMNRTEVATVLRNLAPSRPIEIDRET